MNIVAPKNKLTIVSRTSSLAMWQAEFVKKQLNKLHPDLDINILGVVTTGDKILDKSLDKIGGKGLFIKELEKKLLDHEADIAVHSLKDVSVNVDPNFIVSTILQREDPRDAFISTQYDSIKQMPKGSIIGTSSARRIAQLKHYHPSLQTKLLRGNINTRLNKLENNEFDAIILASAGVTRLGLEHKIKQYLDSSLYVPAIGQGALAIEILASQKNQLDHILAPLHDKTTAFNVKLERQIGKLLNASCSTPLGVYVSVNQTGNSANNTDQPSPELNLDLTNNLTLHAMIANTHNYEEIYFTQIDFMVEDDYLEIAMQCINNLKNQGAGSFI
jgi:hydroxymethylbilane synthase